MAFHVSSKVFSTDWTGKRLRERQKDSLPRFPAHLDLAWCVRAIVAALPFVGEIGRQQKKSVPRRSSPMTLKMRSPAAVEPRVGDVFTRPGEWMRNHTYRC